MLKTGDTGSNVEASRAFHISSSLSPTGVLGFTSPVDLLAVLDTTPMMSKAKSPSMQGSDKSNKVPGQYQVLR